MTDLEPLPNALDDRATVTLQDVIEAAEKFQWLLDGLLELTVDEESARWEDINFIGFELDDLVKRLKAIFA